MPHIPTKSYHNNRVLIGNYIEERNAADFDAQLAAKKLATGQTEPLTAMQRTERRIAAATSKVELAVPETTEEVAGGTVLHFDQPFMLSNVATGGLLSIDLDAQFQEQMEEDTTFKVTSSGGQNNVKDAKAQARNVFHFVPYETEEASTDSEVKYGQQVCLQLNSPLFNVPMFVTSERESLLKCAPVSRHQVVSLTPFKSYAAAWTLKVLDHSYRLEMENTPVHVGIPFVLSHCQTNNALASAQKVLVRNDYDAEYEVYGKTHLDQYRNETAENQWHFCF